MKFTRGKKLIAAFVLVFGIILVFSITARKSSGRVKNVIVMISDGCGYNQIQAADYYQYGKTGTQIYEKFPVLLGVSTYPYGGSYDSVSSWSSFNYPKNKPTDSAAASTAMATGIKSYNAAIGVDINKQSVKNISEYFQEQKKSTGVVTTVQLSNATPAGFTAHNTDRNNYSDIAKEMILSSKTDVIMGAGNPDYDDNGNFKKDPAVSDYKYVGGKELWEKLVSGTLKDVADSNGDGKSDPWTLIQSKDEFLKLSTGKTPDRVIGVPQVHNTLQQAREGDSKADAFKIAQNNNVPSLGEMSKAALNVLDNNKKGFFLMIEGGAVDWAGHANQSGRLIEEEIDFNKAVEAVDDWVQQNSNWEETVLIVTGDHETGYLTGSGSDPSWIPIKNNGAGNMPGMQWNSTQHTNSIIPLFAKGDAAELLKDYADETDNTRGKYIDNIEIAKFIKKIINVN
ncbi:MAG: alkaline phosphatase [Clostridiaceae bacterium]